MDAAAAVRDSGACSAAPPCVGEFKPGLYTQGECVAHPPPTDALKKRAQAPPQFRMLPPLPPKYPASSLRSRQTFKPL